jgi:iron complex transport system substrate-binding protein
MAAHSKALIKLLIVLAFALAVVPAKAGNHLLTGRLTSDTRLQGATRIISLVPAVTEMLYAIGAGEQVIAVSSYDTFPPQVKQLPSVGALLDPNVERILSLKPDLVVVYGSQTDLKTQMARAGIGVFDYRHAGLRGVTTTIRELGARTGHAVKAGCKARRVHAHCSCSAASGSRCAGFTPAAGSGS